MRAKDHVPAPRHIDVYGGGDLLSRIREKVIVERKRKKVIVDALSFCHSVFSKTAVLKDIVWKFKPSVFSFRPYQGEKARKSLNDSLTAQVTTARVVQSISHISTRLLDVAR